MTSPDPVAASKTALRDHLVTQRRRLGPADLRAAAEGLRTQVLALDAVRQAATVAAYVSVGHEPGTGLLLDALRERGVRVLLPVVLRGLDLDWAAYGGAASLAPARRGLLEPTGTRLGRDGIAAADVVLVPATAVDTSGHRLGQGGGCYDRALARVPRGTPVVALLHEDEVVEQVPHAPHDLPVSAAVTPSRTVVIDAAAGPARR
ncbi:5-formyltetrahydrofolate cyclo-ligase [Nocardioidaceae bacterium]|nr:5-formyltetrahydrofolate cyclo-ligase [Nocardioidaceae bacterium]